MSRDLVLRADHFQFLIVNAGAGTLSTPLGTGMSLVAAQLGFLKLRTDACMRARIGEVVYTPTVGAGVSWVHIVVAPPSVARCAILCPRGRVHRNSPHTASQRSTRRFTT